MRAPVSFTLARIFSIAPVNTSNTGTELRLCKTLVDAVDDAGIFQQVANEALHALGD